MQKILLCIALICGTFILHAQTNVKPTGLPGQNTVKITDPVKYNDYIVGEQDRIGTELLKLIAMFDALPEDQQVCLAQLEVVLATCKSAIANVEKLKPIEHEFGLKNASIDLFKFYDRIIDSDYRVIIGELYKEVPDLEKMQSVLTKVTEEEATYDGAFQTAQQSFATYHNMDLRPNEMQEQFDDAGGDE